MTPGIRGPLALALALAAPAAGSGVVVESVRTAFAADTASIREGDVLLSWQRDPSAVDPEGGGGPLDSPFEARRVESEEAPLGALRIRARRDGIEREIEIPAGEWGLSLRPSLSTKDRERYSRGRSLIAGGAPEEGLALWRALAEEWADRGGHGDAAWLLDEVGGHLVDAERPEELREAHARAVGEAVLARDLAAVVELRRAHADRLERIGRFREAAGVLAEAAAEQEREGRELGLAATLTDAGDLHRKIADLDLAHDQLDRALEILERRAPDSYPMADCLRVLAIVFFLRGDFAAGERAQLRALDLLQAIAPASPMLVQVLNNQASLTYRRGDLRGAEALYRQANELLVRLGTEDRSAAANLANLAGVASRRGDLLAAERFASQALEIEERTAPGSPDLAVMLKYLGEFAIARGDFAGAERWMRRALAVQQAVAADDPHAVLLLAFLSEIALERGDADAADDFSRQALESLRRQGLRNLDVASSLKRLARVKLRRHDRESAARLTREALEIEERLVPDSLSVAESLHVLGELAAEEGDLEAAESLLLRALGIRRRGVPGTLAEARSSHAVGMLYWRSNRPSEARELLARAAAILDGQAENVGRDYETLAEVRARNHDLYRDYLQVLVAVGRPEEAFHVLERSRARAFLEILAMRDLSFAADLPPELDLARRQANAAYDEALRSLTVAGPEEAETLGRGLAQARERREEVRSRIRLASPRLAAVESPRPLDLRGAREVLEDGTLLLAYAVADDRTYLFAVGPGRDELDVHTLEVGESELREEVLRFRSFLRPGAAPGSLAVLARRLGDLLMAPVGPKIARAERLALATDGPLHDLPFAVLAVPDAREPGAREPGAREPGAREPGAREPGAREPYRFLVEALPMVRIHSVTSLAETRRRRRGSASAVIAFGDPVYPSPTRASAELEPVLRSAIDSGFELVPLPATRREVGAIARLYPRQSQVYLGPEATEERAKATAGSAAILHIASHVLVDERRPLESAIVLSIPPRRENVENGLLQAWEIFEQVRIDADLVTLSGCDTAGGRRLAGEGMVGLSRAFQYAGARTVLATLWKVTDHGTSHLMSRFYHHLKAGSHKDAALRRAQLDLLRGDGSTEFSHPFYWAAFQLIGDWR